MSEATAALKNEITCALDPSDIERLEWICSGIKGDEVLTVCRPRGMEAIRIAETGRQVTVLNANRLPPDCADKASETVSEAEKGLRYKSLDFYSLSEERLFDCIVIDGRAEASIATDAFAEKAYALLKPGGKIIFTVPLTGNDGPNHKQAACLRSLISLLTKYFCLSETAFFGCCVGIAACRRDEADPPARIGEEVLTEQSFDRLVDALVGRLLAQGDELSRLSAINEKYSEIIDKQNLSLAAGQSELRALRVKESVYREKYDLLVSTVFGGLALRYIKARDAVLYQFKKGDPTAKTIRNAVKKIPGLRRAVLLLRKVFKKGNRPEKLDASRYGTVLLTEGDTGFFARVKDRADLIPTSNGCRYYEKLPYRIGVVCDRFFYDSVYSAADFIYISPDNWQTAIVNIDFLFVVSTWNGINNNEWLSLASEGSERRQLLQDIICICRAAGIPTVFYSKEDPVNYEVFISIAKQCDYVFTTDSDVIPDYIRDCGHERVGEMGFGLNPAFHNPVGMRKFEGESAVLFSGSWMLRHEERCADMCMIFDGAIASGRGLQIVDRNYERRGDIRYSFPDKYFSFAAPAIAHDDLQRVHKLYDWALNINTVKHSPTMFANRVIELQAAGNLLISNMSIGVYNRMPTVFLAHNEEEVVSVLSSFSPEEVYERKVSGVRRVMTGETCYDRIAWLCRSIGLEAKKQTRTVLVVAEKLTDNIKVMFEDQTCPNRQLVCRDELTEELLNGFDAVAFWEDNAYYGVFYLEDMMNAFKYTDCDYITKNAYCCRGELVPGAEHDYTDTVGSISRSVFWVSAFDYEELMSIKDGDTVPNGYSIDHFNYELDPPAKAEDKPSYKVSVIIPVYNNGWFLYGKAFASLRRSSLFEDMEILLIDDGSTDGFTPKMLKYLEHMYPNVRTYFFNDGGSGSASRPRNKGAELASAEYLAYLDPDNESVNDGIAKLYELATEKNADIAIGDLMKVTDTKEIFGYSEAIENALQQRGDKKLVVKTNFLPISNQAMVLRKSVLLDNGIAQVVGGIGEDTLFGIQVLGCCQKIVTLNMPVFIYYACRRSSEVNNISAGFFMKYYPVAEEYVRWMGKEELLEDYMSKRFAEYAKGWFFKKLGSSARGQEALCTKELYRVLSVYEPYYRRNDKTVNRFLRLCSEEQFEEAYEYVCQKNKN